MYTNKAIKFFQMCFQEPAVAHSLIQF